MSKATLERGSARQAAAVASPMPAAVLQDPRKEVMSICNLFPDRIAMRLDAPEQLDMVLGDGALERGAAAHLVSTQPEVGAGRMAMPLARDSLRRIAESVGGYLRPVQLRRTDTQTGEVTQVMVPCGATLASVCPACAERAKASRAVQCREG